MIASILLMLAATQSAPLNVETQKAYAQSISAICAAALADSYEKKGESNFLQKVIDERNLNKDETLILLTECTIFNNGAKLGYQIGKTEKK